MADGGRSFLPPGEVGFFWIVDGRSGGDAVLKESCPLAEAERYGPSLTHPGAHSDFWDRLARRSPQWLRERDLSPSVLSTEYDDWPRGRVTYSVETGRFSLFADRRLMRPDRISKIASSFSLADGSYDVRSDPHYRARPVW